MPHHKVLEEGQFHRFKAFFHIFFVDQEQITEDKKYENEGDAHAL